MIDSKFALVVGATAVLVAPASSHAFTFEAGTLSGDFSSTISSGFGMRTRSPSAQFVDPGNTGGVPGQAGSSAGYGDQGDLNYGKRDFFTGYVKGNHELVLKAPESVTFMARANWLRDFAATRTTGISAAGSQFATGVGSDGLTDDARKDLRFKARLMDLWISKGFELGDNQARIRIGNQVVSWGESLFIPGGINQTNALDIMRISQPGTQLKEAVLPAPIASFATGLGNGLNFEGYVQSRWNANYMPPVGSYWSATHILGSGADSYSSDIVTPKKTGQWGMSLRWQPSGTSLNLGAYVMNYHDKSPQASASNLGTTGRLTWYFPEDRKLYGVSANWPVGEWAFGTELSFRPKDAVALNGLSPGGCSSQPNGQCWVDEKRYQWHLTGMLNLSVANARDFLDLIGASSGFLMSELAAMYYPGMKQVYDGAVGPDYVAAGGWGWGMERGGLDSRPVGTRGSVGMAVDFSVTYDGTLIPGWQVTPEIYYSRALVGRTPSLTATFMKGAQSANFILNFAQNPTKWQLGLNYAKFWGGDSIFDQPFRDRDFIGGFASYNF